MEIGKFFLYFNTDFLITYEDLKLPPCKYYQTLVKTNIYVCKLYSENLLMCLKRADFPVSDFGLILLHDDYEETI